MHMSHSQLLCVHFGYKGHYDVQPEHLTVLTRANNYTVAGKKSSWIKLRWVKTFSQIG